MGRGRRQALVDEFEKLLMQAVEERLRADVPVGSYLSGGVDSSMIVALACRLKGPAINTYTVRVDEPEFDELSAASLARAAHRNQAADRAGIRRSRGTRELPAADPGSRGAGDRYVLRRPAAVGPARSCLRPKSRAHRRRRGRMAGRLSLVQSGEADRLARLVPGLKLSDSARRAYLRLNKVPQFPPEWRERVEASIGGPNAWIDSYGLLGISKLRFYSEPDARGHEREPSLGRAGISSRESETLAPAQPRHLDRGARPSRRTLLQAKGDRVAMHSSVEVRYPFLDEEVFDFIAKLHPRWKLRGFRDKYLLRLLAERWIPKSIARRHKVIFRAPLDSFHMDPEPPFVAQLLSEESLRRTGYFDPKEVAHWRRAFRGLRAGSLPRLSVEMGLTAVVATQLWHHQFMGGGLADLPEWSGYEKLSLAG